MSKNFDRVLTLDIIGSDILAKGGELSINAELDFFSFLTGLILTYTKT